MPTVSSVAVAPDTVQTDELLEINETARPELAVALRATVGEFSVWLPGGLNTIIWVPGLTSTVIVLLVEPSVRTSPPYDADKTWLPADKLEVLKVNGLWVWVAVPIVVAPSRNVAVPVGVLNAETESDTFNVNDTAEPTTVVNDDVVVRMDVLADDEPSSTVMKVAAPVK